MCENLLSLTQDRPTLQGLRAEETMITVAGILVLMLAYAALSLGVICLFWHLRKNHIERGWQRKAARKAIHRLPIPVAR